MLEQRYNELEAKWIINWCWAKWWFSFSKIYKDNIKTLEKFNPKYNAALLETIHLKACWPHDVDFYNWNTYFAFTIANIKFAYRLFKILKWANDFGSRIGISIIVFIWLQKWWKKAFNFWEKKYIKYK